MALWLLRHDDGRTLGELALTTRFATTRILMCSAACAAMALVSACGGRSNTISTPRPQPAPLPSPSPTPTPTPAPTPSPTPTPPPPTNFDTAEFRRSDGAGFHGAVVAWREGVTGQGVTIAVADSGLDTSNTEFAGRIHPASTDLAGNRGVDPEDDHGTNVALVAVAARDNSGVLGIAYEATILGLRIDSPGTCGSDTPEDTSIGCQFTDRNIAAAIDYAVDNGASVVNLSLGGGRASQSVLDAVARAAAAGVVIVVAAGNDGAVTDGSVDPDSPDPFAQSLRDAGGEAVIIVGSIDGRGEISGFSNRARGYADAFITARGEVICCVYEGSDIYVDDDGFIYLYSGTSFAAPQVAGAAALLKQAFPNLTGQDIVNILLDSARDAGAAGTDEIYGRGHLDIAQAFAPQGGTSLAGSRTALPLGDVVAVGSGAMGDALDQGSARGGLDAVLLDGYKRAYRYDLASGLRSGVQSQRLQGAVGGTQRNVALGGGALSMAFTIADNGRAGGLAVPQPLRLDEEQAERARVLAGRVALRLDPERQIAVGFNQTADGVAAGLQGRDRPAFMIAGGGARDMGGLRQSDLSIAVRQRVGDWGITATAESGSVVTARAQQLRADLSGDRQRELSRSAGVEADRRFGPFDIALGVSLLDEDRTILGARFHDAISTGGARTVFADLDAGWAFADGWRLGAAYRRGWTAADAGGLVLGSDIASEGWALDIARRDVFGAGDRVAFRLAQPLRVADGGLRLNLPVGYDYNGEVVTYGSRVLSLSPEGRELMGELGWHGRLLGGNGAAAVFYRREPGHFAGQSDDAGVAVRWSKKF